MHPAPKITVLGTGSMGACHLRTLRRLGVEALAIPVRAERCEQLAGAGFPCVRTLEEARSAGVRSAVIATDTGRHARDARLALELGMDVLCEKPLAPTADEAAGLRQLVGGQGPQVFLACCLRFDRGLQAFGRRLAEIGTVHSVRIVCRSYLPEWRPERDFRQTYSARSPAGGVLLDLIHEVDYAVWQFGLPRRVTGLLVNTGRLRIETPELAAGLWSAPRGAMVSVELDYLSRFPSRRVRAAGSRGDLEYDFLERRLILRRVGREPSSETVAGEREDMYVEQMRGFLGVLGGQPQRDLATLEDGLMALAVCDAWKRSAASHREEEVSIP